jgi:hypothetical protein
MAALNVGMLAFDGEWEDKDLPILCDLVSHVVLPPQLPQSAHNPAYEAQITTMACNLVSDVASQYALELHGEEKELWRRMERTINLFGLSTTVQLEKVRVEWSLNDMIPGGKSCSMHLF